MSFIACKKQYNLMIFEPGLYQISWLLSLLFGGAMFSITTCQILSVALMKL